MTCEASVGRSVCNRVYSVLQTERPTLVCLQTHPYAIKKRPPPLLRKPLCHTLTDYRTIVEDFYKVVEFVEWLKEYYPEKIPLIVESK